MVKSSVWLWYSRYLLSRRIRGTKAGGGGGRKKKKKEKSIMTFSSEILAAILCRVFEGRHRKDTARQTLTRCLQEQPSPAGPPAAPTPTSPRFFPRCPQTSPRQGKFGGENPRLETVRFPPCCGSDSGPEIWA